MNCGEIVILDEILRGQDSIIAACGKAIAYYSMLSFRHAYDQQRLRLLASRNHGTPPLHKFTKHLRKIANAILS